MPVRGGSKGKKKPSLQSLSLSKLEASFAPKVFREIQEASDRTAAILAATSVQSTLREYIIVHLARKEPESTAPLLERDGALATFFAKIHLAFAMGLISKVDVGDLEIIRRVRNVFAHSVLPLDFADDTIEKEVRKLALYKPPYTDEVWTQLALSYPGMSQTRTAFLASCMLLVVKMLTVHVNKAEAEVDKMRKKFASYLEPDGSDKIAK